MNTIKRKLAILAASLALVLGFAAPAAAQSVTTTVTDDHSINVNGDCSGVVFNEVAQNSEQNAGNASSTVGGNVSVPIVANNEQNNNQNTNQSNSQSSSQSSSVTFAPDCSVTNVTQAQAAQVDAPEGGVKAGAGAFAAPLLGLGGSLGSLGYGVLRLRRRG